MGYKDVSPNGLVLNEEGRMKNEETALIRCGLFVSSFIILNSSFAFQFATGWPPPTATLTDWLQTPTRASFT